MTNKVELRVNVLNQLSLYRTATFKDRLSFLDEDIQNAQRAKASNVWITLNQEEGTLTIKNDGKVLEDPQALFSMNESGWDKEIQDTENPFGLGFFSNISVSPVVEVTSGTYNIVFDVDKILQSRDTEDIAISELEEVYDGFKLTLHKFPFDQIGYYRIKERAKLLGAYVHELNIYLNDSLMEKAELFGEESEEIVKIDEDNLKGWLKLSDSYGCSIRLFYKGRFITTLTKFSGASGDLHINDKCLNLTAPDRKDIVQDDKYTEFINLLELRLHEIAMKIFQSGSQDRIDELGRVLKEYLKPEEIIDSIQFEILSLKDSKDFLSKLVKVRREHCWIESLDKAKEYLDQEAAYEKDVSIEFETDPSEPHHQENSYSSSSCYTRPTADRRIEQAGTKVVPSRYLGKHCIKFWVEFTELEQYYPKLESIIHYDLDLIIARNRLEAKALKDIGKDKGLVHISDFDSFLKIVANMSGTAPLNRREQRALMLFDWISSAVGFDHNVFSIANVKMTKILEVGGLKDVIEIKDTPLLVAYEGHIYIDRSVIRTSYCRQDLNPDLGIQDYKFIIGHIHMIIDELLVINGDKSAAKYMDLILGALAK